MCCGVDPIHCSWIVIGGRAAEVLTVENASFTSLRTDVYCATSCSSGSAALVTRLNIESLVYFRVSRLPLFSYLRLLYGLLCLSVCAGPVIAQSLRR